MTTPKTGREKYLVGGLRTVNDVHALINLARQIRGWYRRRRDYVVTVRSDDLLYPAVHTWLLGLLPPTSHRTLLVRTVHRYDRTQDKRIAHLVASYDDTRPQKITVAGHPIRVHLQRAGSKSSDDDSTTTPVDAMVSALTQPDTLTFTATSETGQQAIVDHLTQLHTARTSEDRRPTLHSIDKWDGWSSRGDLPARSLDSVVLAAGQIEAIVDDMQRFLDGEADYNRRGLPYHRGYLLEGPPGTGKTSLVKALASHFGLDLWSIGLGDVSKDTKLLDLIASVTPRSILLLEDIDVFAATRERDKDNKPGLSLSGLLNALDGVATPHGLLTILTTNRPDALDPALVRAGRIDRRETIGLPDAAQAARLFEVFYGHPPSSQFDPAGAAPAEILELFKRHEHDPAVAEAHLHQWIDAAA